MSQDPAPYRYHKITLQGPPDRGHHLSDGDQPPMSDPTPSIEQLNDDLSTWDSWVEVGDEARSQRIWGMLDELATLRAEVAAQREWRARAEGVLRQLVEGLDFHDAADAQVIVCVICDFPNYHHALYCPVVQARALLGEGGQ